MSNYEKFKQIINPYLRTARIERSREEGNCFSSLFSFCCGSDSESSPEPSNQDGLKHDQRTFIVGIKYVADKLMRGEVIFPQDFAGNVQTFERQRADEDAPLLHHRDARRTAVSQTNPSGKPYFDFLPTFDIKNRDGAFNLFLNAVYNYLHSLENEGEFSNELMREFEKKFGDFVTHDDQQGLELDVKNFFINSIKKSIPMQTRDDDINDIRSKLKQISGASESPPRQPVAPAASLTTPPPASDYAGIGSIGSYGTSYTGPQVPSRAAKK